MTTKVVLFTLLSESGKLFTFGDNSWGQLGLGHTKPVNKPSRVKSMLILDLELFYVVGFEMYSIKVLCNYCNY